MKRRQSAVVVCGRKGHGHRPWALACALCLAHLCGAHPVSLHLLRRRIVRRPSERRPTHGGRLPAAGAGAPARHRHDLPGPATRDQDDGLGLRDSRRRVCCL